MQAAVEQHRHRIERQEAEDQDQRGDARGPAVAPQAAERRLRSPKGAATVTILAPPPAAVSSGAACGGSEGRTNDVRSSIARCQLRRDDGLTAVWAALSLDYSAASGSRFLFSKPSGLFAVCSFSA